MKTEVLLVTPEIAKQLLSNNGMNRHLDEKQVSEYSRQMKAGLWRQDTGEAIKIATDKTLLDGQYRLNAIIKANVSLEFLIISDLEKEIFDVIDTGKKRSPGDIFSIAGVKQANKAAAGIRKYVLLKLGVKKMRDAVNRGISVKESLNMYNKRASFWDGAVLNSSHWYINARRLLPSSEILAYYAFFYDINPEDSFRFMDLLSSGINLEQYDPIKQLRDKLIFSSSNTKFKISSELKLALIFKAWNLYRTKGTVKILRYNPDLDTFPIPI